MDRARGQHPVAHLQTNLPHPHLRDRRGTGARCLAWFGGGTGAGQGLRGPGSAQALRVTVLLYIMPFVGPLPNSNLRN